jgi:hypothetical protein
MKILKWIIITPIAVIVLLVLMRFIFCRPNYFTVKTATPMVEKIAKYIVTHGVPESLDNIPDLPYELEGCNRKEVYWKDDDTLKTKKVNTKAEATRMELFLSCVFYKDQTPYSVNGRFVEIFSWDDWSGKISIKSGKTSVGISFEKNKDNKIIHSTVGSGFDNRFGFCRQFKQ